jgi:PD-(D/E)XK endonuclease
MGIRVSDGRRCEWLSGLVAGATSRGTSTAKSKATDRSVRSTRAKATSKVKSKATDRSVRPTLALISKQLGELAEMMFMVKAAMLGFATAKPYGDSRRYDFILDVGRRLWRVQVKSTSSLQCGSYMVNLQRNANGEVVPYDPSEIDFVVAYVLPCDAWFVIPVEAIAGRKTAKLCLHGNPRSGKLGKYWQAWGLMTMRWPENE